MPFYVYVHGLNSGSTSRSGKALQEIIGAPVFCPQNDYSRPFPECLAFLEDIITRNVSPEGSELCIMGTSLGAFYALQLRLPHIGQLIAWNPVIYPAVQLARFIGENTRFTDNVKWNFPRESCLSYAGAPDPRVWENEGLAQLQKRNLDAWQSAFPPPKRDVVLGIHDELLDHELSRIYWQNHASLLEIDSGHHIEHFDHVMTLLELE